MSVNTTWDYMVNDFELKSLTEQETKFSFKGYASIFDVEDRVKDVMHKGAFKRTIDHHKGKFPLVFMHDMKDMLGGVVATEDQKGLHIDGFLLKGIPRAMEVRELMKAGVIDGMSFAYKAIRRHYKGSQRHLLEVRMGEVTLGPKSMVVNPGTEVTEVKGLIESYNEDLKNIFSLSDRPELEHKSYTPQDIARILKAHNNDIKNIIGG